MNPHPARHSKTLAYRLWWMFLGWGMVGIVYAGTHYLQDAGRLVPELWPDRAIVYDQRAIWVYLSFFILIPLSYLRCGITQVRPLAAQMQWSALVCGVVYLLYPTTLAYPPVYTGALHGHAMSMLVSVDSAQNCFPSLHALLSVLAVHALWHKQAAPVRFLYATWLLCILVSILLLKRHLFIDVAAGVIIASAVIAVSRYRRSRRFKPFFFSPAAKRP